MSNAEESIELRNANKVVIYDNREAIAGKLFTGGAYQYVQTYIRNLHDLWNVTYSTSSEIDYCPLCGTFMSCSNCMDYDRKYRICNRSVRTISTEQLIEKIRLANETENMSVSIN